MTIRSFLLCASLATLWTWADAFATTNTLATSSCTRLWSSSSSSESDNTQQEQQQSVTIESVIQDNYPEFYSLLSKNENVFTQLQDAYDDSSGYTIFAPNSAAFAALEDKKRQQLDDPRNLETAQKMGLYHIVAEEALSMTQLNREDWTVPKTPEGLPALKYGALVTLGGEVPIGRFKTKDGNNFWGNLLGGGGSSSSEQSADSKDGPSTEIIVGPEAKILRSLKLGNAIIHEVDSLVSPVILWRYCDQLRIPGF
ncbi:expressed unknown protein [Seminavis robusta]|uniref:FAS1 domain-containing protein n=1 Tax=Seminavis robusta TaxID=568900 RepID=A0A9N8EQQ1_9STRA|nr:expressed unknown protein [Seminavis robusta]|eukprot:Sro1623_g286660.1 n/a (255) ;mRNA; f:17382-18146